MHRHDSLRPVRAFLALALLFLATRQLAAQPLAEAAYKTGDRVKAAFRPVVAETRKSTVRIFVDGKPAALGVVVSADGFVLTKGTQLLGDMTVHTADGRELAAKRVATDGPSDLALLKVEANDLTPAEWADGEPAVGSWLVSAGEGRSPVGVGVVSVAGRVISPQRGVLGIILGETIDPKIMKVLPGTGAEEAGLQVGDVITTVAGEAVETRDALLHRLSRFSPGDSLALMVRRGDKVEEVNARLGSEAATMFDRQAKQNMMGGPLSVRSGGFDLAIQHDTTLRPEDCGGPVVDLSGRVVGINIARAGRVESYALPTAAVRPILAKLMATENQTARK